MNKATKSSFEAVAKAGKPEFLDWGFRFLIEDELTAFQVAYAYRDNKYGTKVEFCPNIDSYSVTIFNEFSTTIGIDRS